MGGFQQTQTFKSPAGTNSQLSHPQPSFFLIPVQISCNQHFTQRDLPTQIWLSSLNPCLTIWDRSSNGAYYGMGNSCRRNWNMLLWNGEHFGQYSQLNAADPICQTATMNTFNLLKKMWQALPEEVFY